MCGEGYLEVRQKGVLGDDLSEMARRYYSNYSKKTD